MLSFLREWTLLWPDLDTFLLNDGTFEVVPLVEACTTTTIAPAVANSIV
jgi:hypothetical protein